MRKKIVKQSPEKESLAVQSGLDLVRLAQIELTSEDQAHPIEAAFASIDGTGWVAAEPGEQTIRLVFDEPQQIKRIKLLFREKEQARTQEFLLRWLPTGEKTYREIVRQQYNFSPPNSTEESEDYAADLDAVCALELRILPDISGKSAFASLAHMQVS